MHSSFDMSSVPHAYSQKRQKKTETSRAQLGLPYTNIISPSFRIHLTHAMNFFHFLTTGVKSAPGTTAFSSLQSLPATTILDSTKLAPGMTSLSDVVKSVPGITALLAAVLLLSSDLLLVKCTAKTIAIMATMMTVNCYVSDWEIKVRDVRRCKGYIPTRPKQYHFFLFLDLALTIAVSIC